MSGAVNLPARRWVRVERHGGSGEVAELVLARVGAMNAISTEMARQLAAATDELAAGDARCVVVTSAHEKAFCVGADLKERNSFTDADLLNAPPPQVDVICAGDICYERPMTEAVLAWLAQALPELGDDERADLLTLAAGSPLAAVRLQAQGVREQRACVRLGRGDTCGAQCPDGGRVRLAPGREPSAHRLP